MKKTVLFVCTHNSARSQMAEAFLRHFYDRYYEAWSAGTEPRAIHPLAYQVMKEVGIDLSPQRSKSVDEFLSREIDLVVTVCDSARESCPYFPYGKKHTHRGFVDPSAAEGSEEEKLEVFRRVRDEIKDWIKEFFEPSRLQKEESLS